MRRVPDILTVLFFWGGGGGGRGRGRGLLFFYTSMFVSL